MSGGPVLIEAVRGDLVESVHRGSVAVVSADGGPEWQVGTVEEVMYPRSCAKPIQCAAMRSLGFTGPAQWLALGASSHSGTERHVALVRAVLADAGLNEDDLQCPPAEPWGLAGATAPRRVTMNCSGKHAAMLATCVINGWPTASYLLPDHPLQLALRTALETAAGEPVRAVSVDGCGAPVFALSLLGLARAYLRLDEAVAAAMASYPDVVGGPGRRVTELMQAVPGLVAKDGAEGVYAARLPDGRAVALKIDDGASPAADVAIGAVLRRLGPAYSAVSDRTPVLGGGRPVGELRPSAVLG